MTFRVIDTQTGNPPDVEQICLNEQWAQSLNYCHIDDFALLDDGSLALLDKTGYWVYCPEGRFEVRID